LDAARMPMPLLAAMPTMLRGMPARGVEVADMLNDLDSVGARVGNGGKEDELMLMLLLLLVLLPLFAEDSNGGGILFDRDAVLGRNVPIPCSGRGFSNDRLACACAGLATGVARVGGR